MSSTSNPLPRTSAAGAGAAPAAVWANLWIVYIVWGSTYLAIRVMVETMPPLLGAGIRFLVAGAALLGFLMVRRGAASVRIPREQLAASALIGVLLPGANAVVTVAEVHVPSGLAALLIASIPLVVIALRAGTGDRVSKASMAGVAIGFAGVALLLLPGHRPEGATLAGMLGCVGAAVMWGSGSFLSPRVSRPRDPWVSTGWQMLLGGAIITLTGILRGEGLHPDRFSLDSVLGFAYLVIVGSLVAFSAYVWLLQNAPVSKVSTYAYVNPVIAIVLGALILGESVTPMTVLGAAIIVASVAVVVRVESRPSLR